MGQSSIIFDTLEFDYFAALISNDFNNISMISMTIFDRKTSIKYIYLRELCNCTEYVIITHFA